MFEFENVGSTIKALAKIICRAGILISLIVGVVMLASGGGDGLVVMIVGPISSWIGSIFTYGFGELIEKTTEIAKNIENLKSTNVDTDDVDTYDNQSD